MPLTDPKLRRSSEMQVVDLSDEHEQDQKKQERILQTALAAKRVIEGQGFRPPLLPEVAMKLTELSGRKDATFAAVEKIVASDPAVAAQVMSRANSAFFSRGSAITSLRVAVTRLGLAEVRDIAFELVARAKLFRVPEFSERMRDLLDQAQAAGLLARETCRMMSLEPELAFLCGLLHDMGEAIILGVVADLQRGGAEPMPLETRQELVARYHGPIGAKICELWKLPTCIGDAVANHHAPEKSTHPAQMAKVVAVADRLLEHAGLGVPARPASPMSEPLFYALNLRPDQVQYLLGAAEKLEADRQAAHSREG